jgi:hypothetical protein
MDAQAICFIAWILTWPSAAVLIEKCTKGEQTFGAFYNIRGAF